MVGQELGRDLLSFGVKTLVIGDRSQLPSIGGGGYFTNVEPDFRLTEIHRQEALSPIIKLATTVRLGGYLRPGKYGDSAVLARGDALPPKQLLQFGQVLVGTHRTRCRINSDMRRAMGFTGPVPIPGEKVVCLKNSKTKGIFNGVTYQVISATPDRRGFYEMNIKDDDGRLIAVVSPVAAFGLPDNTGCTYPENPFDHGYAITVHKAQGSQWDSVYIVDESHCWRPDDQHFRWLYTAISRAADQVTVAL
jgi:exodeoxyribonuclease-5